MIVEPGPLLAAIDSPDDLKKLAPEQLVQLSTELRDFIIDSVSIYGATAACANSRVPSPSRR